MSEQRKGFIAQIANVVSTISGLTAIGLVVFYGGGLAETVKGHEVRINAIETIGTRTASEHIALDDQRDVALTTRVQAMEADLKLLPRIDTKLDELIKRVDKEFTKRDL